MAALSRARRPVMLACVGLAAIFAGFGAAAWHTATIAAPLLDRMRVGQLTGCVESVEARAS